MIEQASGSLTAVNLNQDPPQYFWNGERLAHVTGFVASVRDNNSNLVLRVIDPKRVTPALPPAEIERLEALYEAMEASNIDIKKVKG